MQAGMSGAGAHEGLQAAVNSLQLPRDMVDAVNREIATHPENFTDIAGATEVLDRIGENPGGHLLDAELIDTASAGTGLPQPAAVPGGTFSPATPIGLGATPPATGLPAGSLPTLPAAALTGPTRATNLPAGVLGAGGSPIPALTGAGNAPGAGGRPVGSSPHAAGQAGAGNKGGAPRSLPPAAGMPRLANAVYPGAPGSVSHGVPHGSGAGPGSGSGVSHPSAAGRTPGAGTGAGGGSALARGGQIVSTPPARGGGNRAEPTTKAKTVTSQVEREGNLRDLLGARDPVVPGVIGSWVFEPAESQGDPVQGN